MRYAVVLAFALICSACAAVNMPPLRHTGPKISGVRLPVRSDPRVFTWNTGFTFGDSPQKYIPQLTFGPEFG